MSGAWQGFIPHLDPRRGPRVTPRARTVAAGEAVRVGQPPTLGSLPGLRAARPRKPSPPGTTPQTVQQLPLQLRLRDSELPGPRPAYPGPLAPDRPNHEPEGDGQAGVGLDNGGEKSGPGSVGASKARARREGVSPNPVPYRYTGLPLNQTVYQFTSYA